MKYSNIIMWILIYVAFTVFLYVFYIKDEWHIAREEKGLIKSTEVDYPTFKEKCIFGLFKFSTVYKKLWGGSVLLSATLFFPTIIFTVVDYDITNVVTLTKTLISIFLIYLVFCNYDIDDSLDNNAQKFNGKDNILKYIIQSLRKLKDRIIHRAVKYEYTQIAKNIESNLDKWYLERSDSEDKLGTFITRLDILVKKEKINGIDDGIISLYEDKMYDLYVVYNKDKEVHIMDNVRFIVLELLVDKMGIRICDIANHIAKQITKPQSKSKIKREINVKIKDIKKKKTKNITEQEIIARLLG